MWNSGWIKLSHARLAVKKFIRCPAGFCNTTTVFEEFVASVRDVPALLDIVDGLEPDVVDAVRRCGKQLRDSLVDAPIPG